MVTPKYGLRQGELGGLLKKKELQNVLVTTAERPDAH